MVNQNEAFKLERPPRWSGSHRQRQPLPVLALTSLQSVKAILKRICAANAQLADAKGGEERRVLDTSQSGVQEAAAEWPALETKENQPQTSGVLEPRVFHIEGASLRACRVLGLHVPLKGSGRVAKPRPFTLTFRPPPPPPPQARASAASASVPLAPSPVAAHRASTNASDTSKDEKAEAACSPGTTPFTLDELITLAFENARKEAARRETLVSVADANAQSAVLATESEPSESTPLAAPHPTRTPGPSLQQQQQQSSTPAAPRLTPIEGVPERLSIGSFPDRGRALTLMDSSAGGAAGDSSPAFFETPMEGVPERLSKRPRLSPPVQLHMALLPHLAVGNAVGSGAAVPTPSGPTEGQDPRCGASHGSPPSGAAETNGCPGAADRPAESGPVHSGARNDGSCAAEVSPLPNITAAGIRADLSAFNKGVQQRFMQDHCPAAADCMSAEGLVATRGGMERSPPADVSPLPCATAVGIRAELSAMDKGVKQRLKPLALEPPASGGPFQGSGASSPGQPQSSSSTISNGTPAAVKMQNLAAQAVDAVFRATEAMGGPPTRPPQPVPHHAALPPRPPSRTAAAGTGGSSNGGTGAQPPVTAEAHSRRVSGVSDDGHSGMDGLIHRAPSGTLLFPSRTPSPMGGVRWPLPAEDLMAQLGAAPLHRITGAAEGAAAMVTPTLDMPVPKGVATAAAPPIDPDPAPAFRPRPPLAGNGKQHAPAVIPPAPAAAAVDAVGEGGPSGWNHYSGDADAAIHAGCSKAPCEGPAPRSPKGPTTAVAADSDSEDANDDPPVDPGDDDIYHGDDDNMEYSLDSGCGGDLHGDSGESDGGPGVARAEVLALPEQPGPATRGAGSALPVAAAGAAASGGATATGSASGAAASSAASGGQSASGVAGGEEASKSRRRRREEDDGPRFEGRRIDPRKSLAGNGLVIDEGRRRSTRNRTRPLQYWRGEAKEYSRKQSATLPTVVNVRTRTPEPKWPLPTDAHEKAKRKARAQQLQAASVVSEQQPAQQQGQQQ